MSEQKPKFTMTITDSILARAEAIKKDVYYNTSYSEMYRQLIELGMNSLEEGKSANLQQAAIAGKNSSESLKNRQDK